MLAHRAVLVSSLALGLASTLHIYGEAFKRAARADSTHIPYKGDAPAMTDLLSGRVQYMFNNPVSAINYAKQGRVRILAVTGEKRLPALPVQQAFLDGQPPAEAAQAAVGAPALAHLARACRSRPRVCRSTSPPAPRTGP